MMYGSHAITRENNHAPVPHAPADAPEPDDAERHLAARRIVPADRSASFQRGRRGRRSPGGAPVPASSPARVSRPRRRRSRANSQPRRHGGGMPRYRSCRSRRRSGSRCRRSGSAASTRSVIGAYCNSKRIALARGLDHVVFALALRLDQLNAAGRERSRARARCRESRSR